MFQTHSTQLIPKQAPGCKRKTSLFAYYWFLLKKQTIKFLKLVLHSLSNTNYCPIFFPNYFNKILLKVSSLMKFHIALLFFVFLAKKLVHNISVLMNLCKPCI